MRSFICLSTILFSTLLFATPVHISFQGRLFDNNGNAIESGSIPITTQLLDPTAQCLLYEESHTVNMDQSDGFVSLQIGAGTQNTATAPSFTLSAALSNVSPLVDPQLGCAGNSFNPGSTDKRLLRVIVDGTTLEPDQPVNSVPYSLFANQASLLSGTSLGEIQANYQNYSDQNLAGSVLPDIVASPLVSGDSFRWDGSKWEVFQAAPADLPTNSVTLDDLDFASSDGINIPQLASDPGSPAAGQTYYNTTSNKMMVYNGTTWIEAGGGASNLNGAYDGGSIVNVDSADVIWDLTGTADFRIRDNGADTFAILDDGDILVSGTATGAASVPATGAGTRMFFDIQKGVFRAGSVSGTQWDNSNVGSSSAAFGYDVRASGNQSFAQGAFSVASGQYSAAFGDSSDATSSRAFATGSNAQATGDTSVAMGWSPTASGGRSFSLGSNTTAESYSQITVGAYNLPKGGETSGSWVATDPLFVVGNGTGSGASRSNALTVLKNGDVGIGTETPNAILDLSSTTNGFLSPRMTTTQRDAIATPATGLQIYNITTNQLNYYNGSSWQVAGGSSLWTDNTTSISRFGDVLVEGSHTGTASVPASGLGTKMFFDSQMSAFRAGYTNGTQWDDGNIGAYSTAMGFATIASGPESVALNRYTVASGNSSTAIGSQNTASGDRSFASGFNTNATGSQSTSLGNATTASGSNSTAMGWGSVASGLASTAIGRGIVAGSGTAGDGNGDSSIAVGLQSAPQATEPIVTGDRSMVLFFDGGVTDANDGYDFSDNDTFALIGGELLIDGESSSSSSRGCIRFNDATDQLEYSNDCSSYIPLGGTPPDGHSLDAADGTPTNALFVDNTGNVGIGTTNPDTTLSVNGSIRSSASVSNATTTVDFSTGNLQHTTLNCGSFNLHNLKDGGSYMFAVQGTASTTCSFSAYSDAGITALTVHLPPDHGATTSAKHTIYNLAVLGTHVYIAWTPGY